MSAACCDELSVAALAAELAAAGAAAGVSLPDAGKLLVFDEIDSTNAELLRRLASAGNLHEADGSLSAAGKDMHLLLAAASTQTAGRGRVGRKFYSPAGNGIYFSFVHVPRGAVTDPAAYTAGAAVAVCRAVEALFGVTAQIKWVNDVYVRGKKICGILTEGFSAPGSGRIEAAVVGIGINIHAGPSLPPELAQKAGGILADGDASSVTRSRLLARCLAELFLLLGEGAGSSGADSAAAAVPAIDEYRRRSLLTGRNVIVSAIADDRASQYEAHVLSVTDDAGLLVQLADGSQRVLRSGEVTLHSGN